MNHDANKFHSIFENWKQQLKQAKENAQTSYDKELAKIEHKNNLAKEYEAKLQKIHDATKEIANESNKEMKALWEDEIINLTQEAENIESNLMQMLLPDKKESVIMEIRAGEGGDEASIFAMELSNMYSKAAKKLNWDFKTFSTSFSESGGLKEGIFEITGKNISYYLDSESGVHCVKRVPKTEKKGRIHTSTATVAVLIEPEDIEVKIEEKDLKIDFFRSSGPGGQSVNTTDSAVRITHLPTGIVVSQQDEKSQHKNREKALKILKARVYQKKLEEAQSEQAALRKQAVGKAKRNERIRTYHFLQNWVKDDRIDNMCHNVESFMESSALIPFLEKLLWENIQA